MGDVAGHYIFCRRPYCKNISIEIYLKGETLHVPLHETCFLRVCHTICKSKHCLKFFEMKLHNDSDRLQNIHLWQKTCVWHLLIHFSYIFEAFLVEVCVFLHPGVEL